MESSDRKNVYLTKTGDNSLNSGMRDTMIVGQANMAPGIYYSMYIKITWIYIVVHIFPL